MSPSVTMRAAIVERHGAAMRIATVDRPQPGPRQVLVCVAASGVNPLDLKIHAGTASHARHPLPAIPGLDVAGTVEAVGPDVTGFRVGDEVYGMTGGVGGHQGSLAEYQVADVDLLAPKPANLSMREAATLPLVAITAWEGLVDRARVGPGQRVLVQGGAGGVGHMAVQIAQAFGAQVFATGSAASRAAIMRLGATFIDYQGEAVADYVDRHTQGRGFDLVYDTVGGATLDRSFEAVGRFGHVVSALGWGTHALAPLSFKAGTYSGVFTLLPLLTGEGRARHGEILRAVTQLVETGRIAPRLEAQNFGLDAVDDAYRLIARGSARGKVVVSVGSDAA